MAFIDTRSLPNGHRIDSDLCIVGAGAAGLAIAGAFLDRGLRVTILESGGLEPDAHTQALYRGSVVGQPHAPLDTCRLRFFGGTTNHWTAHVRTLDAIDFADRPWVPYSGWPLKHHELDPYYERARVLLRLAPEPFELKPSIDGRKGVLTFDNDRIETQLRQIVPLQDRLLGPRLKPEITRSRNVDVCLFANVLEIELNESRNHIAQLRVGTLDGVRISARARRYVLAAGGIENPRILLLSSIGSREDPDKQLVGGFYANHPGAWGGYIVLSGAERKRVLHGIPPAGHVLPLLRLTEQTQRRLGLLNCWLEVRRRLPLKRILNGLVAESIPSQRPPALEASIRDEQVAHLSADMDWPGRPTARGPTPPLPVYVFGEPAPTPSSRVQLGDATDALGQRRVVLDWRLSEQTSRSARETLRVLARETGGSRVGRMRTLFPGFESVNAIGTHHHMGTTRMNDDPRRGVVDRNCRVHGISNLYVAGSSVFPTYGTANPTYTLLALAYRLADHLRDTDAR